MCAPISARRAGVLRQHRGADAQALRPLDHADHDSDRPHGMAARPHPALSHRTLYRALVDDRYFYGIAARRAGRVRLEPGAGALAFCAVVILTMFAAETFDPG